jgi:hypothetical protein
LDSATDLNLQPDQPILPSPVADRNQRFCKAAITLDETDIWQTAGHMRVGQSLKIFMFDKVDKFFKFLIGECAVGGFMHQNSQSRLLTLDAA